MHTGSKSGVKIGRENVFGTEAQVKYKVPFTSESLNHKADTVESEALLGNRAIKSIAPGKEGTEGSLDIEAYPGISGFLFFLALGKSELAAEKTKISPIDINSELPSATVEVDHSGSKFKYIGMTVNSLKFSGAVGDIPKITLDMVGKEELQGAATAAAQIVDPGEDPYYFKELTLFTDQFTTQAELYSSIELNISNNLDTDDYRLDGTGKRKTLGAGKLDISGSIDMYFDSSVLGSEYTKYKNFADAQLGIKLVKTGKELSIFIPRIKFTEMPHDIGGPEKILVKGSFKAVIPAVGDIMEVIDSSNTTGTY